MADIYPKPPSILQSINQFDEWARNVVWRADYAKYTIQPIHNVKGYGAVGDGVTDDTTAIKNAIESLSGTGGVIYLPPGTYLITSINWGSNGNGIDKVHLVGSGMGVTVLKQASGRVGHAICVIDSKFGSIKNLTIDSSSASIESGIRTFCCQDFIIENVEVVNGDFGSLTISGPQFGLGTLSPERVTVRNCIVRGQRTWPGNATACFIAGNGAKDTTFINCKVLGGKGDYFGSDYAFNTRFVNCEARNVDGLSSAGFWIEGEQGDYGAHGATLIGCIADGTQGGVGCSENGYAKVIGCRFENISTGWSAWSRNGLLTLDDCIFYKCCQTSSETQSGGVLAERGVVMANCRFVGSLGTKTNVNIYSGGSARNDLVSITGCVFDLGIFAYERYGPKFINISNCLFGENAVIVTYNAYNQHFNVVNNTFLNRALSIGRVNWVRFEHNTCYSVDTNISAIWRSIDNFNALIRNNTFVGYTDILTGSSSGTYEIYDNRFINVTNTVKTYTRPFSCQLSLTGDVSQKIPGTSTRGAYFIIAAGTSNDNACSIISAVSTSYVISGTINIIQEEPSYNTSKKFSFSWPGSDGIYISFPEDITVNVIVIPWGYTYET